MIDCLGKFFATVVLVVGNLAILALACVLIYSGVASYDGFKDFSPKGKWPINICSPLKYMYDF